MAQNLIRDIVAPAVKKLLDHITKNLGYAICSSKHVNDMKEQFKDLENKKVDVEKRMETNALNNKEIPAGVPVWVKEVVKAATLKEQVEITSGEGYGCLNIIRRYGAGKKACEATKRIKDLTKENDAFVWTNAPIPTGIVDSKPATSTPSSHGVNFKSRDEPFNKALKWLQQDNNKSQVIALCGMGGVGKTTMMEQLKTKANDNKMFDYIVPVVIGNTPNMYSIQNDIAVRLTGERLVEETISERADDLCKKFKHILEVKKKRILVTLDDVWKIIELKEIGLTSPLPNGLKLLLTSRLSDICEQIAASACSTFEEVKVGVLEKDEAVNFFFRNTNVSINDDRYAIGCEIVEKCGSLPFAIKIIGTTLNSQTKPNWNTTLRRLKNNRIDDTVQEVIKISYEYIKHEEDKEVLLLCGLFPEDYDIRIEDLTRYAWGLNLFKGVSTLGDARDSTKTCVGNLINSHLLINCDGCVKMHDLVLAFVLNEISKSDRAWIINHGNATQLAGREEMVRESCKRISLTCMGMSEFPQDFKYPNLSLLQLMNGDLSLKFPDDFYVNMKSLQVIAYYMMESPLMLPRSLHCSTNLKSLCLCECKLMFDISFVGDLVNLEVLSFACCRICKLPSAIGKLVNLRLLDLRRSGDLRIDNGVFENLKNLEELYMSVGYERAIRFTDSNIKELAMVSKQLRALEVNFVETKNLFENFSFEKLDNFNIAIGSYSYREDLFVNNLKLVTDRSSDLHDCKINKLFKKTENLRITVKDMIGLKDVLIVPSDPHSFSSLKDLRVECCSNLKYLFPVCMANGLKKLERLTVRRCDVLEALIQNDGSEISDVVELPQLLQLELYNLPNFTSIYPVNNNNSMCALFNSQVKFPKLEKLEVVELEKLKQIWGREFGSSEEEENNNTSMLRDIDVCECDSLVNLFPSNPLRLLTNLERLQVTKCGSIKDLFNINLECIGHEVENSISKLKEICVWGCDSLVNLFPTNPMRLLTHLENVNVENCGSIEVIFNIDLGYEIEQVSMNNLRSIEVKGSENVREVWRIRGGQKTFTSICGFESLEILEIEGCRNVFTTTNTKFDTRAVSKKSGKEGDVNIHSAEGMGVVFEIDVNNQQPLKLSNLQRLGLYKMDDISHVWKCNNWNKYLSIPSSSFHNLAFIKINKCNRIKYLFSPLMAKLLSNLHTIDIRWCDDMEEVVSNRDDDDDDKEEKMSTTSTTTTFFPRLHSLKFCMLKNLKRIGGGGGGQAQGTKNRVIHDQFKVPHVGVVSWYLYQYSKEIFISSCNGLSSVIPSNAIGQMQKLEVLRVEDCESLAEVFETQFINGNNGDGKSSTYINEESVGINVISRQANINVTQLSNMKILEIESCKRLLFVFTFSMLESLTQLEELLIRGCKAMKVIVKKENVQQRKDVVFPCLKVLKLHTLPNLEGFFLGLNDFKWPLLEKVMIYECPQMTNFTCGRSTTPALKDIHTSLGKHSLESGLNFHHLKTHLTRLASSDSRSLPALSFHNLIDLRLEGYDQDTFAIPSNELLQLQKLGTIRLDYCNLVNEVFEVEGANEGSNGESQIVIEIPNLRQMELNGLNQLKHIWKSNQRRVLKFPNLTTLSIRSCGSLKHVFTSSMVGGLLQLQDLQVKFCNNMEVIVKTEEEEDDEIKEMAWFPFLKSLKLSELESLKGFCLGKVNFSWPSLHTLKISECPEIRVFTNGHVAAPALDVIDTRFGRCYVKDDDINSFIVKENEINEGI